MPTNLYPVARSGALAKPNGQELLAAMEQLSDAWSKIQSLRLAIIQEKDGSAGTIADYVTPAAGASSQAFGGPEVVADGPEGRQVLTRAALQRGQRGGRARVYQEEGPTRTETVTVKGGVTKEREIRKGYVAEVDGKVVGTAPTELAARGLAAIFAFMTRDKLGRIQHALERLQAEFPDQECKVWACCEKNGIRATVDGEEYAITWLRPEQTESKEWEAERFKKLTPSPRTGPTASVKHGGE